MTVPRGTHPHWSTRNGMVAPVPLYPHQDAWECGDALGVDGAEKVVALHLARRERVARYAGFDRLGLDDGPMVRRAQYRRRRYRRARWLGALAGALLAGAAWYGAYGAERNPMIASTDESEVCASDGLPGSSYSRAHRVVKRKPVPGMVIDHTVPLCLGGADNDANIQLQRLGESMDKDDLERAVCIAVCRKHTMTLAEGQAIFLGNWRDHLRGIDR